MAHKKIWFITGCSTGFGKELTTLLLEEGYQVVITARNKASIESFATRFPTQALCLELDVTKHLQIDSAVAKAYEHFGRIDVVVNNAGYGIIGAIEEISEHAVRSIFEVNFFGLLNVTRAFLPKLREQNAGHIINLSSVAGLAATGGFGIYNATKFALEGFSEALAQEVAAFNIAVTLVEPGPFRTDFLDRSMVFAPELQAYTNVMKAIRQYAHTHHGKQPGDPIKAARAILQVAEMPAPPLRLPLGKITLKRATQKIESLRASLEQWAKVASDTDFE